MGLGQRPRPVRRVRQVVEGAEHHHRVDVVVREREVTGVALVRGDAAGTGALDVARDEVHELDLVAVALEPLGMHADGTTDVEDPRVGREGATEDQLGPEELDPTFAGLQAGVDSSLAS